MDNSLSLKKMGHSIMLANVDSLCLISRPLSCLHPVFYRISFGQSLQVPDIFSSPDNGFQIIFFAESWSANSAKE